MAEYHENSFGPPLYSSSIIEVPNSADNDEGDFEVDQILNRRQIVPTSQPKKTDYEYLVLWKGCDRPSWERYENLNNCREKLAQFFNRQKENLKMMSKFVPSANSDGEDSSSSSTQSSLGSPSAMDIPNHVFDLTLEFQKQLQSLTKRSIYDMVTEDTFAHEWHSLSEEEKEKRRTLVKTHVKSLYPVPSNPNDREISAMDEGESPRRSTRSIDRKRTPPSADRTSVRSAKWMSPKQEKRLVTKSPKCCTKCDRRLSPKSHLDCPFKLMGKHPSGEFKIAKIVDRFIWRCKNLVGAAINDDEKYYYKVIWDSPSENWRSKEGTPKYVPFRNWVELYPKVLLEFKNEKNL